MLPLWIGFVGWLPTIITSPFLIIKASLYLMIYTVDTLWIINLNYEMLCFNIWVILLILFSELGPQ